MCQLLKDPHPQRLSVDDCLQHKSLKADILQVAPDWSPYLIDMASSDKDPIVYIDVPQVPGKTNRSSSRWDFFLCSKAFSRYTRRDSVIFQAILYFPVVAVFSPL